MSAKKTKFTKTGTKLPGHVKLITGVTGWPTLELLEGQGMLWNGEMITDKGRAYDALMQFVSRSQANNFGTIESLSQSLKSLLSHNAKTSKSKIASDRKLARTALKMSQPIVDNSPFTLMKKMMLSEAFQDMVLEVHKKLSQKVN